MSGAQIKFWHQCFKLGQESVKSNQYSERLLKKQNMQCMQVAIKQNQQLTVQELEDLEISQKVCLHEYSSSYS